MSPVCARTAVSSASAARSSAHTEPLKPSTLRRETMDRCLFCAIASGKVPAHIVYEDDRTIAFLDIHPSVPGHTLIIPSALACLENGFKWSLNPFTDLGAIPGLTPHPHLLTETTLLKPTNLPQTAELKGDNTLDTGSKHQGHFAASGTQ